MEYRKKNRNATILPLTLLGRDVLEKESRYSIITDSSSSVSKDLFMGVAISTSIIVMLVAVVRLLSIRKRLANRRRNARGRQKVNKQQPENVSTDRHEELEKFRSEILRPSGRIPSGVLTTSEAKSRPCEIDVGSQLPAIPDPGLQRWNIRCQSTNLRPVSLDMGDDWIYLRNPVARFDGENQYGSRPEVESTSHSRLTVFENNAYEDTITSTFGSRADVCSRKPMGSPNSIRTPRVMSPDESTHTAQFAEQHCDDQATTNSRNKTASDKRTSQSSSGVMKNAESQIMENKLFSTDLRSWRQNAKERWRQNPSTPSANISNASLREQRVDKEAWVPLRYHSKTDTIKSPAMSDKNTRYTNLAYCNNFSKVHNTHNSTKVASMANGSANLSSLGGELLTGRRHLNHSISLSEITLPNKFPPDTSVTPISASQRVDVKSLQDCAIKKNYKKKRKVKRTRRERNRLRDNWHRKLHAMRPVSKSTSGRLHSFYGQFCNFAENEQDSERVGNLSLQGKLWKTTTHGESDSEEHYECKNKQKKKRISESTLLEEIWKHLSTLVEQNTQDSSSISTCDVLQPNSSASSAKTLIPSDDSLSFHVDSNVEEDLPSS